MTDPLDVLRTPGGPVAPDPEFARKLRARIERALELPRGVAVSTATIAREPRAITEPPAEVGAAIPYLAVNDARRAINWYVDVLGASLSGDPIVMPDGRIGHAELALAGGKIYLADEHPEIGVVAPQADAAAVSLVLKVDDVDALVDAATATGAQLIREIAEAYGSRNATIVDPFNHRWMLQQPLATVPATEAPPAPWHQGDIGYVSVWTPDPARAEAFYGSVLGWQFEAAHDGASRRVRRMSQSLAIGLFTAPQPDLFCCFAVGDVDAAVARIRAGGGTAEPPTEEPYGRIANCTDPEGRQFAVFTPPAADPGERPALNGTRNGDLSYVTFLVQDSAVAREFYGAVLGWEFTPGSIADGWQVTSDIAPMSGMAGGNPEAIVVPMWRVDDIADAVAKVRAAGGTATEPEQQPYGVTSECVDDQGTRFYLGQH